MADDIDLYGNIEEDEFRQEGNEFGNEGLYDDIINDKTGNHIKSDPHEDKKEFTRAQKVSDRSDDQIKSESFTSSNTINSGQSFKRFSTYVGNLTWWTTDIDVMNALKEIGVDDVLEIKFHENRQNGQSKGFCVVVFSSEATSKKAMDKLPQIEIHGQKPLMTYCNRQNLMYFEKQSGSGPDDSVSSEFASSSNGTSSGGGHHSSTFSSSAAAAVAYNATKGGTSGMVRNSLLGGPNSRGVLTGRTTNAVPSSDPNQLLQQVSAIANLLPPSAMAAIRTSLFPGAMSSQPATATPPMPNFNTAPPSGALGHLNSLMPTPPVGLMNSSANAAPSRPPFVLPPAGATAHVNPNFFGNSSVSSNPLSSLTSNPPPSNAPNPLFGAVNFSGSLNVPPPSFPAGMNPSMLLGGAPNLNLANIPPPQATPAISEFEFNDIFDRNKAVSTSAINRAVQDAAAGDYASAIETLVTAISLIKQSKIATDDRCRVLINSLQDTLHSIEGKYGSLSSARPNSPPRGSSRRRHRQRSGTPSDHGYEDSRRYERRRGSREDSYSYYHRREAPSRSYREGGGSRSRHHPSRSPTDGHYSRSRRERSPVVSGRDEYYSSGGYWSRR